MAFSCTTSREWVPRMTPEEITAILKQTFLTTIELSAPFLLIALVIGILVSLFQSFTQMNEITLSFIPKILLTGLALTFLFPWMLKILTKFTFHLIVYQWEKITSPIQYAL